jgi:hypothetical protein
LDLTDVTDADVLEELAQGIDISTLQTDAQPMINEDLGINISTIGSDTPPVVSCNLEAPGNRIQLTNQANVGNLGIASIVIDRFPSGNAGAPISGFVRGPSAYESDEAMHVGSVWAPFKSKHDWKIARWAKMRGPTSSAVAELLEIPEVRTSYWQIFTLLTYQ